MLLIIVEWLQRVFGWKVPSVFTYFSTRMLLAAAFSLLLTIVLGPWFIRKLYQLKIGQSIRSKEECPLLSALHSKKKDTPTMGGGLILFSLVLSIFLWMDLRSLFTILLLSSLLVLGTLGAIDDFLKLRYKNSKGLSARKKMVYQLGFSALVAGYLLSPLGQEVSDGQWFRSPVAKELRLESEEGRKKRTQETFPRSEYMTRLYLPFIKDPIWNFEGIWRVFAFGLMIIVIMGASNAVNLTDGLDGLAAGCLVMVSSVLALFAFLSNHIELARYLHILYIEGSGEIAVFLLALAGACLGFLWYNGYPAQVFMGDTGSLALGGALGLAALLLRREFVLALAGAIFVAEALSVIGQVLSYRYRNQRRIFLCAPLHHHFEYKGWPETKIVIRFWIIGLLFAIISIASLKFQ